MKDPRARRAFLLYIFSTSLFRIIQVLDFPGLKTDLSQPVNGLNCQVEIIIVS